MRNNIRVIIGAAFGLAVFLAAAGLHAVPAYAGTYLELKDDEVYNGAGMSWNGSVLALNGCNFTGQIELPKNATIAVSGVNTIIQDRPYDDSGAIIGMGALTINGGGVLNVTNAVVTKEKCYAIAGKKELTISGVTINASAAATDAADMSAGIVSRKAMKITGSNITATGSSNARTSIGIKGVKSIAIASSNITAKGTSYGIVSTGDVMGISYSNIDAAGEKGALKAKDNLTFVGENGGAPGVKNDRWYVLNGNVRATAVKLTAGQ